MVYGGGKTFHFDGQFSSQPPQQHVTQTTSRCLINSKPQIWMLLHAERSSNSVNRSSIGHRFSVKRNVLMSQKHVDSSIIIKSNLSNKGGNPVILNKNLSSIIGKNLILHTEVWVSALSSLYHTSFKLLGSNCPDIKASFLYPGPLIKVCKLSCLLLILKSCPRSSLFSFCACCSALQSCHCKP